MLRANNPGLIGLAVSASLTTGAAARAESIDAATSQPALSGGPRPIDECGDYGMTTNSTLYGGTTCGLGNDVPEWMSCAGQFARSEDASVELIVPEPGFYDITLDPLGNPWVSVMVHESCPADFTGSDGNPDGVVNVVDLLALLASWGPCEDCPVDINGDGMMNVTDLLELLAARGDCPEV